MAEPLDPYRTLGLAPGASLDEIRRAYRRLAKANHPDSAGEAALPRFLAIQSAYELLITGRAARGASRATGRGDATPGQTWRAEPTRTRSTRDTYARRRRAGTPPTDEGKEDAAAGGPASGATGNTTSGDRPRRPGGRARSPNKATLGSTSYDAAEDEPFEPDWSGGTWYGASSGTYWTINPKEYADPRKHGPEYQRRAQRVIDGIDVDPADDGPSIAGDDIGGAESESATGDRPRTGFDGRWTYPDDESDAAEAETQRAEAPPRSDSSPGDDHEPAPEERPSLSQVAAGVMAGRYGMAGRIALALVGWPPIGVAIAWVSGELTGCGRFAATCVDPFGTGTWLAQLLVIVVLIAAPPLAALSAAGTIAALAVAVPAAVILSAAGGSNQPETSSVALGVVVAVAYVAGVAFAVGRRLGWRRVP